jgi:arsenate reductase
MIDREESPTMTENVKRRVLFLCTGNSCRSQLAEAILRDLDGDRYEVFSAGIDPASEVNPLAIRVLQDRGLDTSGLRPKHVDEMMQIRFHRVITVCDNANEHCPYFPGAERIHWPFEDPATATGTEETRMRAFQTVYRELRNRLSFWLEIDRKRADLTKKAEIK